MERPMTPGSAAGSDQRPERKAQSAKRTGLDTVRRAPCAVRFRRSAPRGFTLIELLIVITIIGILVTLAQPSYQRAVTAAKEATLKENLFVLRDVIDQFFADNSKYPGSLQDMVDKGYLRRVPRDPVTGSADTWVGVPATDDQGQQQGIFDVRSGSEAVALDGTRYADW
jgi:general secretion pathway protein G